MVTLVVVEKIVSSSLLLSSPTNKLLVRKNSIGISNKRRKVLTLALTLGGDDRKKALVSHSNYMVSFDSSSCITRPLAEILRDLNKRIPENIIINNNKQSTLENDHLSDPSAAIHHDLPFKPYIPWYHANRMLSFYAPGWCGEIRDVIFSDNGSVTVVYRVTIRGSDGEAHRESSGTVSPPVDGHDVDVVAAAEEIAFCRACARFGLGLYLYHDE